MQSDGYGGGTANMEFQTLTGLPFHNLSQTVSVLYTEVLPKIHDVPSISNAYSKQNKGCCHLAGKIELFTGYRLFEIGFQRFYYDGFKGIKYRKEGIKSVMNPPIILYWIT